MGKLVMRSELESLFADCVEDVRKDVIKRRLKTEITTVRGRSQEQANQLQFEQTLEKLADMAKGRIKLEEFTVNDRINLLDLFVNSEKTLMVVHEQLFPNQSKLKQSTKAGLGFSLDQHTMLETSSGFDSQELE